MQDIVGYTRVVITKERVGKQEKNLQRDSGL